MRTAGPTRTDTGPGLDRLPLRWATAAWVREPGLEPGTTRGQKPAGSANSPTRERWRRKGSNLQPPGSGPGGLPVPLHAIGRSARWIRTTDLSDPTRVLSQAEPSPVGLAGRGRS